ncbi:MAG: DUF1963 domain-containing protein, partial [Verrucomicrobia bacterium]|nr:DUF1963 domain-containing protein [Verrucomicrobiota bacterium]
SEKNKDIALGKTRLGGCPDLPATLAWPSDRYIKAWKKEIPDRKRYPYTIRRYKFVAQINLAEIASCDCMSLLPNTGMLYFFTDVDEKQTIITRRHLDDAVESEEYTGKVLYYDGDLSSLQRRNPPSEDHVVFQLCEVAPTTTLTIPSASSIPMRNLVLGPADVEMYEELVERVCSSPVTQMLGFAGYVQDFVDMRIACEAKATGVDINRGDPTLEKGASHWILLLQVDSYPDREAQHQMIWGDYGRLYFWIRDDDLRDRNFAACQLFFQGH